MFDFKVAVTQDSSRRQLLFAAADREVKPQIVAMQEGEK